MKETWGCIAARVMTDPISTFLSFWNPMYFQRERGFDLRQVGCFVRIPPWRCSSAVWAGRRFPGFCRPRWSLNRARKSLQFAISCLIPLLCYAIVKWAARLGRGDPGRHQFRPWAWGNITLPAELFPNMSSEPSPVSAAVSADWWAPCPN
jgi:ACS family hexuronate transporter-like MFS transporter